MTAVPFHRYSPGESDDSLSVLLRLAQGLTGGYRVVGGMSVFLLCREHSDLGRHVGTLDVDLALAPKELPSRPMLGDTLCDMGLRPEGGDRHSMYWYADLDPTRSIPVDLLAPRCAEQSPEKQDVAGIVAWCPPGTGAVLDAPNEVVRDGTAWGLGAVRGVRIVVACGPAILMAKARSFSDRAYGHGREVDLPKAGKHAYDIFYLVTSCAGGPAALADEWSRLAHWTLKRSTIEILADGFRRKSSPGSELAAGFIQANHGLPGLEGRVSEQVMGFLEAVRSDRRG